MIQLIQEIIYDTLSDAMVVKSTSLMHSITVYQQWLIKTTILVLYIYEGYSIDVHINEIPHKLTTFYEFPQNL